MLLGWQRGVEFGTWPEVENRYLSENGRVTGFGLTAGSGESRDESPKESRLV